MLFLGYFSVKLGLVLLSYLGALLKDISFCNYKSYPSLIKVPVFNMFAKTLRGARSGNLSIATTGILLKRDQLLSLAENPPPPPRR